MPVSTAFQTVRSLVMIAVLLAIWAVVGMVYADRFIPPFDRLVPHLMPWKGMSSLPESGGLGERLSHMQGLLEASSRVANYAFFSMVGSFALFIGYLTFVYQQRQRRTHENRILRLKNQEIARRSEFIRYISATIGHEFKNNLGRIKRRMDLIPNLPRDASERINENLDKLFADIDVFKKISDERESALVDFRRVDLREMLTVLAKQYADFADIEIVPVAGYPEPVIVASPTLLKTVFENLLDNSIKYKKPAQAKAKVLLSCSMDRDGSRRYISLSFRDEGTGMNEQQADQCFYRSRSASGGWGAGLYYAKYVVGLHAGKIRVGKDYTREDQGTEIIINLPFMEEGPDV